MHSFSQLPNPPPAILRSRQSLLVCSPNFSLSVVALPRTAVKAPSPSPQPHSLQEPRAAVVPEAVPFPGGTSPVTTVFCLQHRVSSPDPMLVYSELTRTWGHKMEHLSLFGESQGRTFHLALLALVWLLLFLSSSLSLSSSPMAQGIYWHPGLMSPIDITEWMIPLPPPGD